MKPYIKSKKETLFQSIQRQEAWRKKQIHTLYNTGRPIFSKNVNRIEYPVFPDFMLRDKINSRF